MGVLYEGQNDISLASLAPGIFILKVSTSGKLVKLIKI